MIIMSRKVSVLLLLMAVAVIAAPSLSAVTPVKPVATAPLAIRKNDALQTIRLTLTFPAGKSPKVFTDGWVFGAEAVETPDSRSPHNISGEVRWKGTGIFNPDRGPLSRPTFNRPGSNSITLYVEREGKVVAEKTFAIDTIDPKGYAQLGSTVHCPLYAMGCPGCPHDVRGKIQNGSPNVRIGGLPAVRVGDTGFSIGGCGPNVVTVQSGDPSVLIEGKPAARVNDKVKFDGGVGVIETGYAGR